MPWTGLQTVRGRGWFQGVFETLRWVGEGPSASTRAGCAPVGPSGCGLQPLVWGRCPGVGAGIAAAAAAGGWLLVPWPEAVRGPTVLDAPLALCRAAFASPAARRPQPYRSTAGADPGRGLPADSVMNQTATPPMIAAAIM